MTPLGPVPFVGRQQELAELKQHLAVVSLVSLHGPLGVGKSRLVQELAPSLGAPCTVIECHLGDRASALRSRAERALRCVPGSLAQTLTSTARVLIIDDIQHLRVDEATNLLSPLALGPTALGRVVVVGRDPLAAAVGAQIAEVELAGLDIDSASALWTNLEENFGEADGWDNAFSRTRGVPLALRREYARARFGANAWDLSALDRGARSALEALAILRQAVAPAAVSALTGEGDTEAALTGLVARQLVDAVGDGRVVVHEVVRVDVLAQIDPERKLKLSHAAAELVASTSAVSAGPRLAWQAGDDGAFGAMDQITRVREVVWHWIAAGEFGRAADVLLDNRELAARSGGAGEFEALLDALGDHRPRQRRGDVTATGQVSTLTSFLDPEHNRQLSQLRIEIAVRGGRYTEAFERASASAGAVSPLLHAELVLASGDVSTARRALTALIVSPDGSERARALARLAELELLAGMPDTSAAHLAALGDPAGPEPRARARVHLAAARGD